MRHCGTSLTECRNGPIVQPMNVARAATVSSLVIARGLIGCSRSVPDVCGEERDYERQDHSHRAGRSFRNEEDAGTLKFERVR